MTRCCRSVVLQQVGSYLGYTGRDANSFGKAARDQSGPPRALLKLAPFNRQKVDIVWLCDRGPLGTQMTKSFEQSLAGLRNAAMAVGAEILPTQRERPPSL